MRRNKSLLLAAGTVLALLSGLANAGIDATKHNMSSSNALSSIRSTAQGAGAGTDEICVFCHTPHMNVTKGDVLPLWNHRLSSGVGSYTMYKSASFNGADNLAGDSVSLGAPSAPDDLVTGGMSVTNLCLSCHDGTQAVNAMFNPPNRVGTTNPTMVGGVDTIPGSSNAYLGTDLQNDHPVNFTYTVSEAVSDETLRASSGGGVTYGGATVRLFNDTVQCASCHDPHKDYVAAPEFTPFLRVSISGSQLCLTCHNK